MEITVTGRHSYRVPPETGLVSLGLVAEAPAAREAADTVSALARELAEELAGLAGPGGPVTWHTVGAMTTSSWRRYDPDGAPLAPRHSASVTVRARFADLPALAAFVSAWALRDACQLNGVDWELSDATRAELEDAALAAAVADARRRATVIAEAAGAGAVRPVSFRDPRPDHTPGFFAYAPMPASLGAPDGPSPLVVNDIEGAVAVEATFAADTVAS
ncbi:SIMPL domain-containing protein [Propioniciclava soli]|uniref:SIMPL domain-containing protein n=1 Tax=Propioniciclava soli TaxID=2775081 RepID=A0ABZ3C7I0_9ACTN